MALAKRCDRCDRYFDRNEVTRPVSNYNGQEGLVKDLSIITTKGCSDEYDLCDECWEKFFNWMNEWKLDEEIEEVESKPYIEEDTKCDTCEYLFNCEACMEITRTMDSRRHYRRSLGGRCLKEEEEMADA